MSGILNKKNRIIDYKLTENGRKQLQNGDINFKYFTLSDSSIIYSESNELSDYKISDSEGFYLPFEVYSEPLQYVNPEFNLTDEVDLSSFTDIENLNTSGDNFSKYVDLSTANSITDQIISKKLLNHRDILNEKNEFVFKEKLEFEEFDFDPLRPDTIPEGYDYNSFLVRYPTVSSINKSLAEIKSIKNDLRFKHKINYSKLPPVNIDGSSVIETEEESVNPLNYVLNNLKHKTNIQTTDGRELAISKVINSLEEISNNRIYKNIYVLNEKSNIKKYLFEMHEIQEILGEQEIDATTTTLTKGLTYKLVQGPESLSIEDSTSSSILEDLVSLGFDSSEELFLNNDFVAKGTAHTSLSGTTSPLIVKLKNENFKKLAFIDLGRFFNKQKRNNFRVYLVGKIIYNEKMYVMENLEVGEDNVINRNISRDYSFINLFTIVLE